MKKGLLPLVLSLALLTCKGFSRTDTSHVRISLLTCAPGDELYSIFGHTALRVIDSAGHTDIVYNYGTFDFNDPDFYSKFVRGKLDYSLSAEELPAFLYEYRVTKRDVTEQELRLPDSVKLSLTIALRRNMEGRNRYYKYDFLYDNCTSRVKNLLIDQAGLTVRSKLVPDGTTFRDMIHEYLDRGGMSWTKFGMDLLLGRPSDKIVSTGESMFLPDYLMKGIDSAAYPILSVKKLLLQTGMADNTSRANWPLYVFTVVMIIVLWFSFKKNSTAIGITRTIDTVLFCFTGLTGILLLFTWFGTDHTSFAANYNLLWALPTNIIAAVALQKKPYWLSDYFFTTAIIYGLLLACFFWLPQQFNPAIIPLVILLLFRSVARAKV